MSTSTEHEPHPVESGEHDDGPAITKESHGGHPSDLQYIYVALFLAAVTGIEVWLSYIGGIDKARPYFLIAAAIIKFFFVAAFFMHLKFDSKNLRRLFLIGIFGAIILYSAVLFTFGQLRI